MGYFGLEERRPLFIFLINSMKSTWAQVRLHSFEVLSRFPDSYGLFVDEGFVNQVLMATASELANNPKAMMAEASALFHNLIFKKCLPSLALTKDIGSQVQRQLAFLSSIVRILSERVKTFTVALIKDGSKEALLHGYLSFFKHLFDQFKI
jgi:hypothetical protein